MIDKLDFPPIWMIACMAVAWLLASLMPIYSFDISVRIVLGILAAGFGLNIWSVLTLRKHITPILPGKTPSTLVVDGPFRINRNPIYTGATVMILAVALWVGAISALIPVLFYPWIITRRFILAEEKTLRSEFGDEAEAFLANTRRW